MALADALRSTTWTGSDAASLIEAVDTFRYCGTSGGSANAQTITASPAITAYAAGQTFWFIAGFANTTASPTINVNSLGAKTMKRGDATTLQIGDLVAGGAYAIAYNGTGFLVLDPTPTWQTWTPTQTCSGAMTITGITNREHRYIIGLDSTAYVEATADYTLGGTQSINIFISLPFSITGHQGNVAFICAGSENGGAVTNGARWRIDSTPRIVVFKIGAANWTLGASASYSLQGSCKL